jgi:undecaprenyl-phosphate 4-deoxy-4-formamido-L-arabinose transferase
VYNGEATLGELCDRLDAVLRPLASAYEVILVNDGSRDASWDRIRGLAAERPWVRGLDMMRNYGQQNALLAGIRAAGNDLIVTLDDDLQHPPEEIPKLLAALGETDDVVYGVPIKQQHGLWRNLASEVTKLAIQSAMGADVAKNVSAFRVLRRKITGAFAAYRSSDVFIDVLFTWGTTRFASVAVRHEARREGRSGYRFGRLLNHAVNMITGFSIVPLQVAGLMGLGFAALGFLVLVYVLVTFFVAGRVVPGFAFLASIIALFSGVQLLSLGVLGEYLARIHYRTMDKPTYAIRTEIGQAGENGGE